MNQIKVVIGIQSRLRSKRLPAKALLKLGNDSIIGFILRRGISTNYPVYLLTTENDEDEIIAIESHKYCPSGVIRGSEKDVLERYLKLQKETNADIIVRVTGDNPFTDFRFIPMLVAHILENKFNYSTIDEKYCLEGTNLEVFNRNILYKSFEEDKSILNKEHVTTYMKKSIDNQNLKTMIQLNKINKKKLTNSSLTIDTIDDYIKAKRLFDNLLKSNKFITEDNFIDSCLKLISEKDFNFPISKNHQ